MGTFTFVQFMDIIHRLYKCKGAMLNRKITKYLKKLAKDYPVVTLTGPRQSGKTTLVKQVFPKKNYVSLEDVDNRMFAINDPRGFLSKFSNGAIIDETQYAPELFSYIQTIVDTNKKAGEFILTGSQNFLLLEKVTQSLAGRTAILHLLPLSYEEIIKSKKFDDDLYSIIFNGGYPKIYASNINSTQWYRNYLSTYIERDIRQIKNIADLSKFQLFIKLCAGRVGQLVNMSSLGTECGIDSTTVRAWLSILENSFVIFLLRPHYKNFNKRLVKQPKLYFYDTGLICYLLGIHKKAELLTYYMKGNLFENYIVSELVKRQFNKGLDHNLYFWRDNHGHEVDIAISQGEQIIPIEVKIGETINDSFFTGIEYWKKLSHHEKAYVVYGGNSYQFRSNGTKVINWRQLHLIDELK